MKILVVEHRSEDQALLARKIESIDSVDRDTLDLSISLANENSFLERAADFDVVLLGAGLADQSPLLSSKVRQIAPETEVLVLLPEREYMRGAFRAVLARGARKVFSVSAPLVDIVQ